MYLAAGAIKEVDIVPTQRSHIKQQLASDSVSRRLFDEVQLEIFHIMKRDSFRQFTLHSSFNEW